MALRLMLSQVQVVISGASGPWQSREWGRPDLTEALSEAQLWASAGSEMPGGVVFSGNLASDADGVAGGGALFLGKFSKVGGIEKRSMQVCLGLTGWLAGEW